MNVQFSKVWLSAALAVGCASLASAQTPASYVPNQIVVKFRPQSAGGSGIVHSTIGARVLRTNAVLGYQTIQLRAGMNVAQALSFYRSLSSVESVTPNYVAQALYAPNDPRYNQQWWLAKVGAPRAWDLTLGSPTVKIAVVDTGVDYLHEDLVGKVILGKDFINNDNDPMDDRGHGTHVAGIAAANTNNGKGVAGLGFNAQIIAVKVLGPGGGPYDVIAAGIQNAADLGAQVINLSLGGGGDAPVLADAIKYAHNKGCVIVAAAGNDGVPTPMYPAYYKDAIAVAATDQNDLKADFSNYGADWVDVAAPGVDILSTMPNNVYAPNQGTSMASPVVAGLAGLLKAYAPSATAAEIRTAIESTSVKVGNFIAFGRVNAPAAINSIIVPIDVVGQPKSVGIYAESGMTQGRSLLGGIGNLGVTDGKTTSVETVYQAANGWMGTIQMAIDFPYEAAKFVKGEIVVAQNSRPEATSTVFLYNFLTGKYEPLKSVPGSTATSTTTIALPLKIANYLQDGELRVVVRSYVPARVSRNVQTYRLHLDKVVVNAKVRP
jgi:thermitase